MKIKFNDLDPRMVTDRCVLEDGQYVAECHLKKASITCPACGRKTTSIHSKYSHTFQDLPIQGKPVTITLTKNKYICRNPKCTCKTFTDKTDFISPKGKKTRRLIKSIVKLNVDMSSIQTSKNLETMGIKAKKSAICNYVKKNNSDHSSR